MLKKLFILVVVLAILVVACIPLWMTMMEDRAFENPGQKISSEDVKKSISAKMDIYLFEDARKTAEKAVIYFPESEEMPFFIYNAAICSDKAGNKAAAIYWYGRFLENYPTHVWASQAEKSLALLKHMKD